VVFLIVCANLTNMLLSRGVDREHELSARVALGAGRWRLMRQMSTETTILFAAGGVAGALLAVWCLQGLAAMTVYGLPRIGEVSLDWPVLVATMGVVWLAALVVGVSTVLHGAGRQIEGARGASQAPRLRRVQRALMAAEVAMALVLLLGAGVLAEVARTQARIDPGFNPAHLMQARVSLPFDRYPTEEAQAAFTTKVLARLSVSPGIEAAAAVTAPPGSGDSTRPSFVIEGAPVPESSRDWSRALTRVISDSYFETLDLAPVRGAAFNRPGRSAAPVAIVNTTFARQFLHDVEPVGARLRVAPAGSNAFEPFARTIIGVVPDIREGVLYEPAPPTIYLPVSQATSLRMTYLARGAATTDMAREIRAAVAQVDPNQALRGPVEPMLDAMHESMTLNRLNLVLLGVLAGVAVLLSVVGVYGVTAHNVRHRTREIGIRLALGVTPAAIRRHVIGDGLRVTLAGLLAGAVGAAWAVPALRSLIVGTSTLSPAVCVGVPVLLLAIVIVACDIPARRAAALDPTIVLRGE
jgi:putative ABC transport system permease protein